MNLNNAILLPVVLACIFSGCSNKDKEAKERLEQEQQAASDAAKANKAITNVNQSMFSRMNASTPGATPTPTSTSAMQPQQSATTTATQPAAVTPANP